MYLSCTPSEIRQITENTTVNLLPIKSQYKYEKQYHHFKQWCAESQIQVVSENACLNIHKNVDISSYKRLQAFLKRCSQGYIPKKSKVHKLLKATSTHP
ncbi:hypothetical protein BDFB_012544 [Asbolus verrucosus]|uniref:Uncharacterized protein n=1 Tax=Asbolus verrucosus TaxID=1661398 RepID=A0A482VPA0_ASBVE|nr:hypothetical protein BDFB_012544 [Asbolus verrucosus]